MEKIKRIVIYFVILISIPYIVHAKAEIYNIVPLIVKANLEIEKDKLDLKNGINIAQLIVKYKLYNYSKYNSLSKTIHSLEYRVQPLPVSLVLAVFILETGYGTNRFYYQYNSLFSQKYYDKNKHKLLIKAFSSKYEAIHSFMLLINTNNAYAKLRFYRKNNNNGLYLARYLTNYSITNDYINRIKDIILKDKLESYDN